MSADCIKEYLGGLEGISLNDWKMLRHIVDRLFEQEKAEAEKNISLCCENVEERLHFIL